MLEWRWGFTNFNEALLDNWRHMKVDGAKFWISYKRLAFLSILSHWQLIQNSASSTIVWCQSDFQMGWNFRVLTTALCTALLSSDVKHLVFIFILDAPNSTSDQVWTEKKTNSIQSPGWCRAHFKVVTYANYTVS